MADEYDIVSAFEAIENELIESMIRNMKHHKAEETKEGIQWTQWQTEELKSLEKYKREMEKKYSKKFNTLNGRIEELLRVARTEGNMEQEIAILEAIKKGFPAKKISSGATAEFFKLNDRKLDALIEATTNDMEKAETAILRMANDQYRKVIYNAQVYANTGAGTYEKAVDMATRDFIAAGLNCVEYANGARHTLSDYAEMAIRTASKRAYLTGEGEKRQEWGVSTVIVNKRGNPCPKCLPFCGKVFIDDVWSGGSKKDGNYPLISQAIDVGLYHPRCKDSHTTYFPGISTADDTWTKEEIEAIEQTNKQEAKKQYAKRQAEKFERLEKFSLDGENKTQYQAKKNEWKKAVAEKEYEVEEIKDALDFGYGNHSDADYIKWMDDYDAHNSGVFLSAEELEAIEAYTEGSFISMNGVSRGLEDRLNLSPEDITTVRKQADLLEGALSKYDLDTDIVTHRFERDVSWLTGNGNGVDELEALIGKEYTAQGFTSSGMLPNRSRFTGGKKDAVHFEIVTPKGTDGAFLSMSQKGENEFLYNRNTRFKILDGGERIVKEGKLNIRTMQLEEVEVKERFLKVQVITGGATDDIVEEVVKEGTEEATEKVLKKTVKDDIIIPERFAFKKIKGQHTIDDDIGTKEIPVCNPKFKTGGYLYKNNCGYCSATFEMRRRGYDVIANPKNTMLISDWKKLFNDSQPIKLVSKRTEALATELRNKLSAFGDGARGSLFVDWKGNYVSGHFFSWEVEDGVVRFIDGQNGDSDVSRYLGMIKPTKTICLRWDNLEPSDMIKDACKNRGGE